MAIMALKDTKIPQICSTGFYNELSFDIVIPYSLIPNSSSGNVFLNIELNVTKGDGSNTESNFFKP